MNTLTKHGNRVRESLDIQTLSPGIMIDHYKVLRAIGRGGMGEVYLARDTLLGRKVALKLVLSEALSAKDSVDRFLFEARATARFNHPHIITIYGVGAHQRRPYVALEYLEGQTLFERMQEERPSQKESLRISLAVAEALKEAHRNNILHRDLKPENIFLPRDGRLRVLDFGLAKAILGEKGPVMTAGGESEDTARISFDPDFYRSHDGVICGTPMYMPPEQWAEQAPTGATDIWAWGIILYELLSGKCPYDEPTVMALCANVCSKNQVPPPENAADIPRHLLALLMECLDKKPENRPTASQVVEVLQTHVYQESGYLKGEASPFRGLLPFTERQADIYFGRTQEVDEFLEKLRTESLLPIVGPSGVGKSSFVQAGIIPRLKEQGRWIIIGIRPGRRPFETLASKISSRLSQQKLTVQQDSDLGSQSNGGSIESTNWRKKEETTQQLVSNPGQLSSRLQGLAEREEARILLFVDQLEEVFTLVDDESPAQNFLEAICGCADDAEGLVKVVFTLRDDFLVRLADSPRARNSLRSITVLRRLTKESLTEILNFPVQAIGYSFEDREMVPEMISHVHGEPAALPLLQFTCQMLWERRGREQKKLKRSTYLEIGGVIGALAHHADGMLEGLSADSTQVAKNIFLRLVTENGTRKILPQSNLIEGLGENAQMVLDRMIGSRLVLVRKGHGVSEGDAEVELVHESLIRGWGRLAKWLEEGREEIAFLAEVGMAAELWNRRGRRKDEVWRGAALHDALHKMDNIGTVPDMVQHFLEAGLSLERRKTRRNWFFVAAAFFCLLLVSFTLALQVSEANRQRERAEVERVYAETQRAQALREGVRAALLKGNLVEARAKLRLSLEIVDSPLSRALFWRLTQNPIRWIKRLGTELNCLAFSPAGQALAVAGGDGMIYSIDIRTRGTRIFPGQKGVATALSYSPSGGKLTGGFQNGMVQTWDLRKGTHRSFQAHDGAITDLSYDPSGRRIATGSADKTIRLWHAESFKPIALLRGHTGRVEALHIGPRNLLVSGGSDKSIRIWNLDSFENSATLRGHTASITDVSFDPTGRFIASSSWDRTIRLWNTDRQLSIKVLRGHMDTVESVSFSGDSRHLASGSSDKTIRIWDLKTGEEEHTLTGHKGFVYSVRYGPKGESIASAGSDETVRLWKTDWKSHRQIRRGHEGMVVSAEFSPDGSSIITGSVDKTIRFWNTQTGEEKRVLKGLSAGGGPVAVSGDGKLLATTGRYDNTVQIFDMMSGALSHVLKGHSGGIVDMEFNHETTVLATASKDSTIGLWDVKTGERIHVLKGHGKAVTDVSFSPDSSILASGSSDNTIRLWHMGIKLDPRVFKGHKGTVYSVVFDSKGDRLASASADGTLRIWNLITAKGRVVKRYDAKLYDVAFHPDGEQVGLALSNGLALVVDLKTGNEKVLKGHLREVVNIRFHPNREMALTTGVDGTVRTWDIQTNRPIWRAPILLRQQGSLYTHNGWQKLEGDGGKRFSGEPQGDSLSLLLSKGFALNTALADQGTGDYPLCSYGYNGTLAMVDVASSKTLVEKKIPKIERVISVRNGCLLLNESGEALLLTSEGKVKVLEDKAKAIAASGDDLIVASLSQVRIFDINGLEKTVFPSLPGVTSVARISPWLVVGRNEGRVDFIPIAEGTRQPDFRLDNVTKSNMRYLAAGPKGTLVAGYDDGTVGVWSLENGMLLNSMRIHGPINHLFLRKNDLFFGTEIGDFQRMSFGIFNRDYCDILREIWKEVPVIWSEGRAIEKSPPEGHPCHQS